MLKKWGPLAAIVLLAQVVLAFVLINTVLKDKLGGGQKAGEPELFDKKTEVEPPGSKHAEGGQMPTYIALEDLKKITINPAGTNATRFAVVSIQLGLIDASGAPVEAGGGKKGGEGEGGGGGAGPEQLLAPYMGKLKAVVVEVLRSKTIDQFDGEALGEVKAEIKRKLNQEVFEKVFSGKGKEEKSKEPELRVDDVLVTDIIIQ